MAMRSLFMLAVAAVAVDASSVGGKCNVCPFKAGSVCCNATIHQACPGGVECCDCGHDACECPAIPTKTIVELAVATPDLSTLVSALKAGDLVKTLSGPGPFTVFAPTNEAFAALPKEVLAALLKPENKADLVKVLTYHVAAGEVHSDQLKDGEKIVTIEGQDVTAHVSKAGVKINNATVTSADNDASNGVVHIVDKVLLYPGFAPPAPPAPPTPPPPAPTPGCNVCPFTNTSVCCSAGQVCP
eukprot:Hpha_TRINITY_DN16489_c0_g1::TRINITY_DN16489_c0_g1_i5::g.159441::m.159441